MWVGYWRSRQVTVDGIEHTFALNHLASFCSPGSSFHD